MFSKSISLLGLLMIFLISACQTAALVQPTAIPTHVPVVGVATPAILPPAPTLPAPTAIPCLENFTRQPLSGSNNTDNDGHTIYTSSSSDFQALLREIGVTSFCIPQEAGAPFIQAEWDEAKGTAQVGRMVMISFDRWREASLIFSTYDFAAGTEYDTFASSQDYESIKNTSQPSFMRIFVSGACFGKCWVYKTYVFPSENSYTGLTLYLGAFDPGQTLNEQVAKFNAGELPAELQAASKLLDGMAAGLATVPGFQYESK